MVIYQNSVSPIDGDAGQEWLKSLFQEEEALQGGICGGCMEMPSIHVFLDGIDMSLKRVNS